MGIEHIGFHRRASMALSQLTDAEQARVLERLKAIADIPPTEWPARVVRRVDVSTPLFLVRVDHSLRVLISAPDGHVPEVLDIVRHETLEQFAKAE